VDGDAEGAVRGIGTRDDYAMGKNAVAIGENTEASGHAAFAEGIGTIASGEASHAEGYYTRSTAPNSHAEGYETSASARYSHAEGYHATASSWYSHSEGYYSTASADYSHAEGFRGKTVGIASHAEGLQTTAGYYAHSEGAASQALGDMCHTEGFLTRADGYISHCEGFHTSDGGHEGAHIMGRYGTADANYSWFLGNGPSDSDRGLAAKILQNGNAYIDVAWNGGGADYAELFETESGQPIEPGYFVTFVDAGKKIRVAQTGDRFILGVVSNTPGFVAGAGELRWKGKFKTNEWGGIVYEDVAVPETKDEDGNVLVHAHVLPQPALNSDFDPNQVYVPRTNRPEWVKVGLLGTLRVRDDGTPTPGGYCKPGTGGIAAAAEEGYRVLERTGANQVLILFR
jgi:hypothetical protein